MEIHYKTDIIERLDDAINEADANMVEIDYIRLSGVEWHLLVTQMQKFMWTHMGEEGAKMYRDARLLGELTFRGIQIYNKDKHS